MMCFKMLMHVSERRINSNGVWPNSGNEVAQSLFAEPSGFMSSDLLPVSCHTDFLRISSPVSKV